MTDFNSLIKIIAKDPGSIESKKFFATYLDGLDKNVSDKKLLKENIDVVKDFIFNFFLKLMKNKDFQRNLKKLSSEDKMIYSTGFKIVFEIIKLISVK